MKMQVEGRKFYVVKIMVALWVINFAGIMYLAVRSLLVPQSLGLSLGTLTAGIASYVGFNVLQKKIETKKEEAHE